MASSPVLRELNTLSPERSLAPLAVLAAVVPSWPRGCHLPAGPMLPSVGDSRLYQFLQCLSQTPSLHALPPDITWL